MSNDINTQSQAEGRNLLVLKASAGSGKTYNLALQYIKHLLFTKDGEGRMVPRRAAGDTRILNAHRQLLAITFTNKATDEMKERIVDELYCLSQPGKESKYLKGFMDETGLDEGQVRQLALQALFELMFDYSNFNVSTIDSFFQSILRNFARELNRDYNYDIQLEEDYAVRVAVHKFLLSLGQQGKPTQVDQWVKEYQRHMVRGDADKKNWKFFDDGGDLNKLAKQINSELFRSRMGEIRQYLGHTDEEGFHSDFTAIRRFKQAMHDVVERCNDDVATGLQRIKDVLQPLADTLWGGRTFHSMLNKDVPEPFDEKAWGGVDEKKILNQFGKNKPDGATVELLVNLIQEHFKARHVAAFFKHIEDNLGLLGLLAMIDLFLEEYRHENNSILIGDTNELIGTVLDSGSDFVYERVGTTIAHFMIDEFQDTSAKQYENFKGLLRESLASGNFNMLIGDAKQSIYRFRNADPTVFRERVAADFTDDIYEGDMGGGAVTEGPRPSSVNYRSSREVIEFNNRLFEYVRDVYCEGNVTVGMTYHDVRQGFPNDIDTAKLPGYVRVYFDNYSQLKASDDLAVVAPAADDDAGGKNVLDILPHLLLRLHERYEWGRIGILVYKNKEGDKVVDCILNHNKQSPADQQISIISGESLLLNNSPIIRRIIAMLRYIDISRYGTEDEDAADDAVMTTEDDIARRIRRKRLSDQRLYTALNGFIQAISAHAGATPLEHGAMLIESLERAANVSSDGQENTADTSLDGLLPPAGELTTLVSIVETVIAHFKRGADTADDVDRETAFLYAFQDTVMQFSAQRNGGSVREFLKYWDEKMGTLAVSGATSGDAINIMSIHKAKGLEFDCVILPFADWEIDDNSHERNYWMPREVFTDVMAGLRTVSPDCPAEIVPPLLHVDKIATVKLLCDGVLGEKASAFVGKQLNDVLIDNLNKTYVAMTRPRTELHIFAEAKAGNVGGLLKDFAVKGGLMTPVIGAEGWYETGTFSTREDFAALEERKRESSPSGNEDDNPVVRGEITGYTVNDIPMNLQVRMDQFSTPAIKAGLRLHGLLSRIHDRADVERAIDQGIKHGIITDDAGDACGTDSIDAHVSRPIMDGQCRVAAWFDPANVVYSERTITLASDSLWDDDGIQNLRPDRIVRLPSGELLVIDYKSGERHDKKYCRQVNRYIAQLRLLFPDVSIAGRIWYVTHDVIIDDKGTVLDFMAPGSW